VPISIQRETSSHYDRPNPDWSGQVFHSRGVPVAQHPEKEGGRIDFGEESSVPVSLVKRCNRPDERYRSSN